MDIYELWWAEGNMDDTMIYTHAGVDYYANWYNGYPKMSGLFDPWNSPDGIVGSRAFQKRGTETSQYYVFNGGTLQISVPCGDPPPERITPLTIQNFQGPIGGDTDNHYWKLISGGGSTCPPTSTTPHVSGTTPTPTSSTPTPSTTRCPCICCPNTTSYTLSIYPWGRWSLIDGSVNQPLDVITVVGSLESAHFQGVVENPKHKGVAVLGWLGGERWVVSIPSEHGNDINDEVPGELEHDDRCHPEIIGALGPDDGFTSQAGVYMSEEGEWTVVISYPQGDGRPCGGSTPYPSSSTPYPSSSTPPPTTTSTTTIKPDWLTVDGLSCVPCGWPVPATPAGPPSISPPTPKVDSAIPINTQRPDPVSPLSTGITTSTTTTTTTTTTTSTTLPPEAKVFPICDDKDSCKKLSF